MTSRIADIQTQLDRLTSGHAHACAAYDHLPAGVQIADEQGGGVYEPRLALKALRALASEGEDDRDALWTALEPALLD